MEFSIHELLWAIINFTIFALLLRLVFWKPLLKLLDERRELIARNIREAEEAKRESERLRREYEERMAAAREEANEIVNKANRAAEEARTKILEEARAEAEKVMERAEESIRAEKERAVAELRREVAGLALMAASRVLERELTSEDNERLVREVVEQAGDVQ